jgi:hypothetical protein
MRPGEASIAPRRQFEPPPPAHRNSGLQNAIPLVTDACISQLRVSEAMSMATAARPLQSFLDVESGLPVLPATTTELRAFLLAQLHWERFRASRMLLVHVLALLGLFFWVPIRGPTRAAIAAACAACFLGALFAGMMEWRWARERNRRAGALSPPGGSG